MGNYIAIAGNVKDKLRENGLEIKGVKNMKQGKKLLRSHKEMLVKLGLDPNNYLLERRGIDENGERFVNLINLKTNKVEKYSL